MKKITLCAINARYTHSNLALLCLKAAVKPNDNIRLIESSINDGIQDIVNRIVEGKPDAIGFSCYIWNIEHILKAASTIKKILPGCFIFMGGPEVSYDAKKLMIQHEFIDMVIRGAGELPFRYFVERFNKDESIFGTPSADIRNGGDIVTTGDTPVFDMDALPFLYDDLTPYKNKMIYYETSRGCPYQCAYCMSANDKMRFLPLERVKREFEFFIKANVRQVKLVDRTFNYPADRAYEIFKALIDLSKEYPQSQTNFHFEISACLLDDKILGLLKTAPNGLIQLEIGIQSTHHRTLEAINRKHDLDKLFSNTMTIVNMENIHVYVDLIAGLPYEGYEEFAKSFNDVYALGAHQLQLGFLKVLKGSPMQGMTEKFDIRYTDYPPYEVLSTHVISHAQLSMLHNMEYLVDTMYNTGHFKISLEKLIPYFQSPFDFYEQLAVFLQRKQYFDRPQKKQNLFELVYRFAKGRPGIDGDTIREALIYDWLCLEKPRNWPRGLEVVQTETQKQKIRELFRDKEWVAENLPSYQHLSSGEIARRCYIMFFNQLFGQEKPVVFNYNIKN